MRHGLKEIKGFPYVGDTSWMFDGQCFCGWCTGKDPSWRSAGSRVEDHARAMNKRRVE